MANDAGVTSASVSERLAEHFARCSYEALPPEAIASAKRVMLDTLACAWAGSSAPGSAPIRELMLQTGGTREANVWACDAKLPAAEAAFLNGVAAAALDYDSLHLEGLVHADIVCLPAVLAVAERQHSSGRDFIAALVLGNDLACRLGMSTQLHKGWFYTSMHGVYAAAAACARLLGLNEDGIRNALGIALAQTSGTQQPMVEKSLTKRLQSAFAARAGVFSALLAQAQVSAPRQAIEGKFGLYSMYEQGDVNTVLADLGRRFENTGIAIKKYPSCACNHAAIEATLGLVHKHDLTARDVSSISVTLSPYMNRLVGGAFAPGDNPQVAAQFSVQYSVASAVLRRQLRVADIQREAVLDPQIAELTGKVRVRVDETWTGEIVPAEVEIITTSKGTLTRRVSEVPGGPTAPISDEDLRAKVHECMALGVRPLQPAAADRLMARIDSLEQVGDMATFLD